MLVNPPDGQQHVSGVSWNRLSALLRRVCQSSLFLLHAVLQIKPGRKSDIAMALRIQSVFKIKHCVQTRDHISLIDTIKTQKRNHLNMKATYTAKNNHQGKMTKSTTFEQLDKTDRQNSSLMKHSQWGIQLFRGWNKQNSGLSESFTPHLVRGATFFSIPGRRYTGNDQ